MQHFGDLDFQEIRTVPHFGDLDLAGNATVLHFFALYTRTLFAEGSRTALKVWLTSLDHRA